MLCSADGSTHTESNKVYRKVKHRYRPNLSPRQRPTAKSRHDQEALAASAEARGATHRARPRSPSLSAAAGFRKLPHTILTIISQRVEPCGRRCSVRPHTERGPVYSYIAIYSYSYIILYIYKSSYYIILYNIAMANDVSVFPCASITDLTDQSQHTMNIRILHTQRKSQRPPPISVCVCHTLSATVRPRKSVSLEASTRRG